MSEEEEVGSKEEKETLKEGGMEEMEKEGGYGRMMRIEER